MLGYGQSLSFAMGLVPLGQAIAYLGTETFQLLGFGGVGEGDGTCFHRVIGFLVSVTMIRDPGSDLSMDVFGLTAREEAETLKGRQQRT